MNEEVKANTFSLGDRVQGDERHAYLGHGTVIAAGYKTVRVRWDANGKLVAPYDTAPVRVRWDADGKVGFPYAHEIELVPSEHS